MITAVTNNRTRDLQIALRLTNITLIWMVIEGGSALALGWVSKSLLLEGFGFDSVIELVSACVLLWRLRREAFGNIDSEAIEKAEDRAAKIVGYTLYLLVGYIVVSSAFGLLHHTITDTNESVWGILIGLIAKIGMPILAGYKLKVAARLRSRALRADAMEAITCGYLSVVLMIGLVATRLLNWWWLDSIAALVLIPFLIKEGYAATHGGCECRHGGCENEASS